MMAQRVSLSLLLSLLCAPVWAQGVTAVNPVNPTGSRLLPNAFASADNIAAQTATFMHGGLMAWDSGGSNWDRLLLTSGALHVNVQNTTLAVTQSGTWNINSITTLPALATGSNTIGAVNLAQYTPVTGRLPVDGSGVTQPVSGTVTANAGTGTFAVSGTTFDGIIKDGTGDTTQANVSGGRVHVDGSGVTQPISGTVTVGTFPDNEPFNLAQIGGNAISAGVGASGTGTQRTAALIHDGTDTAQVTATGGGSLQVECTAGCAGSGGTSAADNSAFTGGTTNVTPMGALYDTTPPAVTDGNIGAPRMNSSRQLMVDCVSGCAGGSTTPSDNFANPTTAGLSASFTMLWDGATWDRAPGNSTDGTLVNLGANNDVTVTGTVTANAGTNLNTSALALESGGNLAGLNGKLPSTATLADNTANPTVSGIAAYMMCFDGSTWDRCGAAASSTAILAGQQAVTGTAAALATNTVKQVCVKALLANTINVYVGPSGVTTSTGLELGPGDSYCTEVSNTNVLYVIASGAGPSVSWAARNF